MSWRDAAAVRPSRGAEGGAAPTPNGATGAGRSCEDKSLDNPPDSAIEWTNYLRWGDRMYAAKFEPKTGWTAGEVLGAVRCTRSNSLTPVEHTPGDGEAAFVHVGTPVHAVVGRAREVALTADCDGRSWLFFYDQDATVRLSNRETAVIRLRQDADSDQYRDEHQGRDRM